TTAPSPSGISASGPWTTIPLDEGPNERPPVLRLHRRGPENPTGVAARRQARRPSTAGTGSPRFAHRTEDSAVLTVSSRPLQSTQTPYSNTRPSAQERKNKIPEKNLSAEP